MLKAVAGARYQPPASSHPIGSFCQERTFTVADVNDRLWSKVALAECELKGRFPPPPAREPVIQRTAQKPLIKFRRPNVRNGVDS